MTTADRRAMAIADIVERTGIDEDLIERLVRTFYANIRRDALLGPLFDARISDWEPHLQRMCAFWSSVALMSGRYHGRPMEAHLPLPIDARHFDRWLELFERTARKICNPPAATHFIERARQIAESLEMGIAGGLGVMLAKGQRLERPDNEIFLPRHPAVVMEQEP
ncbi:MAG: group III truncated hemoglobin [Notoacmeibacter sp.]|nr:group III truncated hemoglobin [Notoacmeibacter sp.]